MPPTNKPGTPRYPERPTRIGGPTCPARGVGVLSGRGGLIFAHYRLEKERADLLA
jgi:hypothetical protein